MKLPPSLILICIGLQVSSGIQAQEQGEKGTTSTFIPNLPQPPVFSPPPPPVAKTLSNVRVDSLISVAGQDASKITILRGAPSTLPDIPKPQAILQSGTKELTAEDAARIVWNRDHSFHMGATVYDHRVSQVHWFDKESEQYYEAMCGFDFGLLAGVGRFSHNGELFDLFLMHSNVDTTTLRPSRHRNLPEIADISPGKIVVTRGDETNLKAILPIQILAKLIASEQDHLAAYQSARREYQRLSAAWELQHPPVPRDETVLLRPHRGSRYLSEPTPEKTAGGVK